MTQDLKFLSNRLCLFDDKIAGHLVVKGNMKVAQQLTLLCYTQTRLCFTIFWGLYNLFIPDLCSH